MWLAHIDDVVDLSELTATSHGGCALIQCVAHRSCCDCMVSCAGWRGHFCRGIGRPQTYQCHSDEEGQSLRKGGTRFENQRGRRCDLAGQTAAHLSRTMHCLSCERSHQLSGLTHPTKKYILTLLTIFLSCPTSLLQRATAFVAVAVFEVLFGTIVANLACQCVHTTTGTVQSSCYNACTFRCLRTRLEA